MALEDIFKALEEQADKECVNIVTDARDQAESILAQARDEAEDIKSTRLGSTERTVRAKSTQRINSVRLESKKRVAAVKEQSVGKVFDEAMKSLEALRHTDTYPALMKDLLQEAVAGVDGEYKILVDQADVDVAKKAAADLGIVAPLEAGVSTIGGVVVSYAGGRIARRNTLEDRLDKVRGFIQADVAELMFS
ncbi:MAG: V-type ATP synthase subunit E [Actinomycetota bacterium]|jgi:vacuolar-type H+-ATPase subunit E/Vma4|nr:V-type ATP synthase subunit E [Actinomycetota bacterium]